MLSMLLTLLVLCASVLGREIVRPCPSDQSCVAFSHCREWCDKAETGQIEKDLTVRRDLMASTCNFDGTMPHVCCPHSSTSVEQLCLQTSEPSRDVEQAFTCGQVKSAQDLRCVGCNTTSPGDWPWMARLLYSDNIDSLVTSCGGVLVSSRHVITAGHCVETGQEPDRVVLGDSDISTEFDCLDVEAGCGVAGRQCMRSGLCAPKHVEVPVRAVIRHPDYEYCEDCVPYYDIAIILLDDLVRFSSFIQPICLPYLTTSDKTVPAPLVMTGWGNIHAGFFQPVPAKVLQQLVLQEVPLQKCGEIWNTKLIPNQICASSGNPGQAPCQGDSGGPLVKLVDRNKEVWELAGVVSFGPGICGNVDHPVGLTRISGDILEWVRGVVGRYEVRRV